MRKPRFNDALSTHIRVSTRESALSQELRQRNPEESSTAGIPSKSTIWPIPCKIRKALPMNPGRAWLAALVEQGLTEYLADNGSVRSSPSPGLFQYEQTLSNLRITPNPILLDTVHLVETRDQRKEVKAVIGDLEHTARATFTKAALDKAAIATNGVPFERLQVGAVFKVLTCEIRVSDCFTPARVDIRITSVAVICPGKGSALFANLKKLEEDPSVLSKLGEYKWRRSESMDGGSDNESMASQEDFMTQIPYQSLKPPSPHQPPVKRSISPVKILAGIRDPEARPVDKMITSASSPEGLQVRSQQFQIKPVEESALSTAHFATQVPLALEKRADPKVKQSIDTVKVTKPEDTPQPSAEMNQNSPIVDQNTTENGDREGIFSRLSTGVQSLWQKRMTRTRYVPRYAGTRAREQQDLIQNKASWQPALIGQPPIEGQVPLNLLEQLSRAADAAAESKAPGAGDEAVTEDEDVGLTERDRRPPIAVESQPAESPLPQLLLSPTSDTSWEPTPQQSAQRRPLMPPDSSPIKGKEEAAANVSMNHPDFKDIYSARSSIQADQTLPSSPFSQVLTPDDEDDHIASPTEHEAPAPAATQTTILDIGPDSDDQPEPVSSSIRLPELEVREVEMKNTSQVQNSGNESDVRGAASSLESIRKVQVWRTPAVGRRNSNNANVQSSNHNQKNAKENIPVLPRASISQSLPPSSQFVPGTYFPQSPKEATSGVMIHANRIMPSSGQRPSPLVVEEKPGLPEVEDSRKKQRRESPVGEVRSKQQRPESTPNADMQITTSEHGRIAPRISEKVSLEADQPRDKKPSSKRKRESSILQKSSKRQKSNAVRSKPVPTGTDPDLFAVEIDVKQYRRDIIDKQSAEHDKVAQERPSHAASGPDDDNSVVSEGRPQSPPISLLSTDKHQVLTPITRSSDYQLSNIGKDPLDRSLPGDVSVKQATQQDTFELFVSTYPKYKGGRTQFEQACQLLYELGESGPRPYLRDDFVYRYNNDYMDDYHFCMTKAGKLPMPFEVFYRESEQDFTYEPISVTKVLKDARLSSVLNGISLKEGTSGVNEHPFIHGKRSFSIASNTEPQLPPVPLRTEEIGFTTISSSKPKSQPQSINHSQDSSVKIWLERASGAESPELGTPPLPQTHTKVPPLDLNATASTPIPATKTKPRTVPWQKQNKTVLTSEIKSPKYPWNKQTETPPSTAPAATTTSASVGKRPFDLKAKSNKIPSRRHTDFPIIKKRHDGKEIIDLTKPAAAAPAPIIFRKPRSNAQRAFDELAARYRELDQRRGIEPENVSVVDVCGWRR